jgi:hypothetical protein
MRALAYLAVIIAAMLLPGMPCNAATQSHAIKFTNNCSYPVWVGMTGNAKPGGGFYSGGGWRMDSKGTRTIAVDIGWAGRFWPRTGCSFNSDDICPVQGVPCCSTGSCIGADSRYFALQCANGNGGNPPVSLLEFAFDATGAAANPVPPYDTYDISLVDGFNVPVMITPLAPYNTPDPGGNAAYWCQAKGFSRNPVCPDKLTYSDGTSCLGPCQYVVAKLNITSGDYKANICCDHTNITSTCADSATYNCCANNRFLGGYGCSPIGPGDDNEKCYATTPGKHGYWGLLPIGTDALAYIANVRAAIPTAYTWQFDDEQATFTCRLTNGVVNYNIDFCPSAGSDYTDAVAAITAIYAQYSAFFGTKSGDVITGTTSSGTYYAQWFANGTAILANTDGYMYFYYGGAWYPFGAAWSAGIKAATWINAIYSEYPSVFGTKSGGITTGTTTSGTYYVQWFTNGTAILANTDGYMYFYYGGAWYPFGVSWIK